MENRQYASFWARFLAWLLDCGIYLLPHMGAFWWISTYSKLNDMVTATLIYSALVLLNPLLIIGYDVISYYLKGSPGKYLTGLEVQQEHKDAPLSFWRFLFRQTIGYQFSSVIFHLGFLAIFKDEKRRGWHDKAISSVVVVKRQWWPIGLIAVVVITVFNTTMLVMSVQQVMKSPAVKEANAVFETFVAEEAQQAVDEAIEAQETEDEEVYVRPEFQTQFMLTNSYIQTQQYAKATPEATKLLSMAKTDVEKGIAHRTRGLINIYRNNYASAQTELLEAEEYYPTDPDTLWLLANVYAHYEDYEAAAEYAEDAISYNDMQPQYYYTLAEAYYNLGMDEEAVQAMQKAVTLDPTNQDYREALLELKGTIRQ